MENFQMLSVKRLKYELKSLSKQGAVWIKVQQVQYGTHFNYGGLRKVMCSLFLTVYKSHIQLLYLGAVRSTGLFGLG